jgi:tetratricopeptide (TPR) repeat protein
LDEAVSICRECGDIRGLASTLERIIEGCYLELALDQPEYYDYFVEAIALYEKLGDKVSVARTRQQFGHEKYHIGDYRAAEAIFAESILIFEEAHYEAEVASTLCNLGRALFQQRRFAEADRRFAEALVLAQERANQKLVAFLIYFRARVAYYQGDFAKAKPLFEESMRIYRKIGSKASDYAFSMTYLSDIAMDAGELASAQTMLREALTSVYQDHDVYAVPLILPHCASVAVAHANYFSAVQLVAAGHTLYMGLKLHLPTNDQMAFDAPLAAARAFLSADEFDQARRTGAQMTTAEAVELALAEISI